MNAAADDTDFSDIVRLHKCISEAFAAYAGPDGAIRMPTEAFVVPETGPA